MSGRVWLLLGYIAAGGVAVAAAGVVIGQPPMLILAVMTLAAVLALWLLGWSLDNASMIDPMWSVLPPLAAVYLRGQYGMGIRGLVVMILLWAWGLRLTANFLVHWKGLEDEDWRYGQIRERSGRAWPLANLALVHLLPNGLVLLGCLPLLAIFQVRGAPGPLDGLGLALMLGGLLIETSSDLTLAHFRRRRTGGLIDVGLWRYSRHPNYFGELCVWWGLFVFALAADPSAWWTGFGALGITLLIRFGSIPMMERRLLASRPAYAEVQRTISALIPTPRRRS